MNSWANESMVRRRKDVDQRKAIPRSIDAVFQGVQGIESCTGCEIRPQFSSLYARGEDTTTTRFHCLGKPPSTLSSPPAFLNSGKHTSQLEFPSGHGVRTTTRPPSDFTCIASHASHLSTSIHGGESISSATVRINLGYLKVMEDKAGAERMQDRIFVRGAEREPE